MGEVDLALVMLGAFDLQSRKLPLGGIFLARVVPAEVNFTCATRV